MKRIMLAAALAVPVFASASNLVVNGGFENLSVSSGGFVTLNSGSNLLTGWTIGGSSIDVVNGAWGAISGNSIDMLGTPGPGSISQTFGTVSGQAYLLSFDLSANMSGDLTAAAKALNVSLNGGSTFTTFTGTSTITPESFQFIAGGNSTTLLFTSGPSGNSGSVLDNVSVTAVPEPETYAMLIAGLGLMGVVARRRKAKQA